MRWTLNKWKITCYIIRRFLRSFIGYINRMSSSIQENKKIRSNLIIKIKLTRNQLYFPIVNGQSKKREIFYREFMNSFVLPVVHDQIFHVDYMFV